jgi:hypothetical protein
VCVRPATGPGADEDHYTVLGHASTIVA